MKERFRNQATRLAKPLLVGAIGYAVTYGILWAIEKISNAFNAN